ncbi:MAG: GlsB/YeaQ/YmgE family stress response membrane protein [Caldilineaceae bacterium]
MSLISLLVLLIIAAICGALGQALAGYSLGGCLISIVVGFVGAFLGAWIARQFNLPTIFVITVDGQPFPVVWSIIGSALFALIVGLLTRPRYVNTI